MQNLLYSLSGVAIGLTFIAGGRTLVRHPDKLRAFSTREMTGLGWCLIFVGIVGVIGGVLSFFFGPLQAGTPPT